MYVVYIYIGIILIENYLKKDSIFQERGDF